MTELLDSIYALRTDLSGDPVDDDGVPVVVVEAGRGRGLQPRVQPAPAQPHRHRHVPVPQEHAQVVGTVA